MSRANRATPVRSVGRPNPVTDLAAPRRRVNVPLPAAVVNGSGTPSMQDTSVVFPGMSSSLRHRLTASGTVESTATPLGQTLDLTGKNLLFWFLLEDTTANSLQISNVAVWLSSNGSDFIQAWVNPGPDKHLNDYGRWMPVEIPATQTAAPLGSGSTFGMPLYAANAAVNLAAVTHIKIVASASTRSGASGTAQATVWLGRMEIIDRPVEPVVTFVFDRFNRNNYLEAAQILAAKGWGGSMRGQVGQLFNSSSAFMTLDMVKSLHAGGWDIGVYDYPATGFVDGGYNFGTAANAPYTNRSKADVVTNLRLAQQTLLDNGITQGIDQCAGQARKLYLDGFTDVLSPLFNYVDMPQNNEYPAFWPPVNPLAVPNKMYIESVDDSDGSGTANLARIKQTIDRAVANNEWLSLLFHDVGNAPSPDGFTITAANFQAIVDYVASKNVKVKTTSQVLAGRPATYVTLPALPFTPASISGLQNWFNADSVTGADGSTVTSWVDSGPAAQNAASTSNPSPVLRKSAGSVALPNGRPYVDFTNTTELRYGSSPTGGFTEIVVAAAANTAYTGSGTVLTGGDGYQAFVFDIEYGNLIAARAGYDQIAKSTGAQLSLGTGWHTFAATFDNPGNGVLYLDGAQRATGTNSNALGTANRLLGNSTSHTAGWQGGIATVLTYNRVLTSDELNQLQSYLKARYGTA